MQESGNLAFSALCYSEMLRHVRMALPREAVGLLGGTAKGEITRVSPLANIADSQLSFLADPYDQFCALRKFAAENLQLLAIYHSHPDGGVEPSQDDLIYAQRWHCAHLIVAVSSREEAEPRLRAFRCRQGGMSDLRVRVA